MQTKEPDTMTLISIVIPVKNDPHIEKTLEALQRIRKPARTEIIVVDASSGSLDHIHKQFPSVRWIHFKSKQKHSYTFSEQMNAGLKAVRGDYIALIDADCIPQSTWLVELFKPIKNLHQSYVTGMVRSSGKPTTYDPHWQGIPDGSYRDEAGSANSLFSRELLQTVGYYDEHFAAGSDIDFSWRAIRKGYKIYYAKRAVLYDDWGTFAQERSRAIRYGRARVQLYRKHPHRLPNLLKQERTILIYPLFLLGLPIAIWFPWYLLLLLIPLAKNYKRQPFRFLVLNLLYGWGTLLGCARALAGCKRL